jgi:23S rRNA (cytidine1920-2'-O)/16S rRNA (cytidine1409-2'-O)-methyltransferase
MTKLSSIDQELVRRGMVSSRTQAISYVRLGYVKADGKVITQYHYYVDPETILEVTINTHHVSRAGLKLLLALPQLNITFDNKIVLDVGSSTGGFTQVALDQRARKVIAVDIGSNQMSPELRLNPKLELMEKTDIRSITNLSDKPDIILVDVSFISLKEILPTLITLSSKHTELVVLVKPQFEVKDETLMHKGIIKNDSVRRRILAGFESWARKHFIVDQKADSSIPGSKGNTERFYKLRILTKWE